MFADSRLEYSDARFLYYPNQEGYHLQGGFDFKNITPSKQKSIRTKPRGLEDEAVSVFGKQIHHLDVHMEDGVWGMLPEDLLTEILARIPPFLIFRLRSVCRRWNLILHNPNFFKYHDRVSPNAPSLLTFSKNSQIAQISVFSLVLKGWHRIPFSFLPYWVAWLVGSSGGLVCFSGMDGLRFRVLVCNPLTQNWRELPTMHSNQQRQLIMTMDQDDLSFTVIAVGEAFRGRALPAEIYQSKQNRWILQKTMPAVSLSSSKMALCNSRLYMETLSPLGMIMFSMGTGSWEHIPARFPRSLIDGYLVAGAHNRLFLVGRIGIFSTLQGMRIWELDHGKVQWTEMSRMPPKYFRALLRSSADRFECSGQDNMICFTSWNQGRGLLHDLDKKVWYWISGCAFRSYNSQTCFYEPRFSDSFF